MIPIGFSAFLRVEKDGKAVYLFQFLACRMQIYVDCRKKTVVMNILKMDRAMGKETSYGKKTKQYHANGCNAISDEWIIMYN